jgi:hypothetical protein
MNNVIHMKTLQKIERSTYQGYVTPEHLHEFLPATETRVITFRSEKTMESYRRMLYTINRQGSYRYRTIRDEGSMWGLVIWRMI